MTALTRALIRLYPASWRARYGAEFEALMDDVPANWRVHFDLVRGVVQMRLSLPSFTSMALVLSGVGLLTGLAVSFAVTPRYQSTSVLMYVDSRPESSGPKIGEIIVRIQARVLGIASLAELIQHPKLDLYARERQREPLEKVVEKMRANLRVYVRPAARTPVFAIEFTYSDPSKAQAVNQEIVSRFFQEENLRKAGDASFDNSDIARRVRALQERIAALETQSGLNRKRQLDSTVPIASLGLDVLAANSLDPERPMFAPALGQAPPEPVKLEVIDPPSRPEHPFYPNRQSFVLTGGACGFLAAVLVFVFRRGRQRLSRLSDPVARI